MRRDGTGVGEGGGILAGFRFGRCTQLVRRICWKRMRRDDGLKSPRRLSSTFVPDTVSTCLMLGVEPQRSATDFCPWIRYLMQLR